MTEEKHNLAEAYREKTPDEARQLYDDWATSYERDNLVKGFRLPWMAAAFLARHLPSGSGPILDAGCGTGLVGESLAVLGYGPITGCDLSGEMMAVARRRGVYRSLDRQDLGQPMPYSDAQFAAFACIGCYGPGHAPPHSLRELVRVTQTGGIGTFNLRESTYVAQGFGAVMQAMEDQGYWRLREKSPAFRPYVIDEPDLMTNIYVVEMTRPA